MTQMTRSGDDDLPTLDGEFLYRIRGQVVVLDADIARMDAEAANIWADTILKRLDAVRQLREMASQLERDDLAERLSLGFDPTLAVTLGDRKSPRES